LRAAAAVLDKGHTALRQREQQLAAIEQGDPVAVAVAAFGMPQQLKKIAQAEERLSRLADAAESAGQVTAATQVVSQQLKSVEIGSRLAGTGGYRPPSVVPQQGDVPRFRIEFIFQGAGRTEEVTVVENRQPIIDAQPEGTPNIAATPPTTEGFSGHYWDTASSDNGANDRQAAEED
jgi:hypothetical protein